MSKKKVRRNNKPKGKNSLKRRFDLIKNEVDIDSETEFFGTHLG